jgi:hypothetical protein
MLVPSWSFTAPGATSASRLTSRVAALEPIDAFHRLPPLGPFHSVVRLVSVRFSFIEPPSATFCTPPWGDPIHFILMAIVPCSAYHSDIPTMTTSARVVGGCTH